MSLLHSVLLITNDTVAREQSYNAVRLWVENVAIMMGEGVQIKFKVFGLDFLGVPTLDFSEGFYDLEPCFKTLHFIVF